VVEDQRQHLAGRREAQLAGARRAARLAVQRDACALGHGQALGAHVGGRQAEVVRRLQREARLVEARGLDDTHREAVVRAVVVAAARAQGRVALLHLEAAPPAAVGQRAHRAGAVAARALQHQLHAPGVGARDADVGLEHAAARRDHRAVRR
jgi:hypothetical protein